MLLGRRRVIHGEFPEATLTHVVQNRIEVTCRRMDLFERRRRLIDDSAACLTCETRDLSSENRHRCVEVR